MDYITPILTSPITYWIFLIVVAILFFFGVCIGMIFFGAFVITVSDYVRKWLKK